MNAVCLTPHLVSLSVVLYFKIEKMLTLMLCVIFSEIFQVKRCNTGTKYPFHVERQFDWFPRNAFKKKSASAK